MISHSNQINQTLRRHDLIFVSPVAWRALLKTRDDVVKEGLVMNWVDRGWPLVARRAMPGDTDGVALGLPLPPFAGKHRLSFLMQPDDIVATARPLQLNSTINVAPEPWRHTLDQVAELASRQGVEARVFGSLAWQTLTGLDYLSAGSDLDLLLSFPPSGDHAGLTAGIAAIEATAPMRLDGEITRDDGAGVNWRELHTGAHEVLVKSIAEVALLDTNLFLSGGIQS
jgi:phosphoribosyl-dephospho-CoA transferase